MAPILLYNNFIITPVSGYLLAPYFSGLINLPDSRLIVIKELALSLLLSGLLFTVAHLLLHTKIGMKNIHYVHHQLKVVDGLGAFYAHPIEHLFGNLLPVYISLMLFATNLVTYVLFIIIAISNTVVAHTEFENKIGGKHNIHHKVGSYNYGFMPYIIDRLIGTYRN